MVRVFALARPLVEGIMKLAGLRKQTLVIEPGTTMIVWVPKESINTTTNIYWPPTKPPVLLIQGFALDGAFNWFPQVLALSRTYSLYVPDVLFLGNSTTNRPERTADFQAEFIAKGMKVLRVERCIVVGLSYGGFVGFRMAKLYPELVKAYVASDTVIQLTESISEDVFKKFGISSWPELMVPETIEAGKRMMSAGINSLPPLPNFVYKDFVRVMTVNLKERKELLEALVIKDEDADDFNYSQRIHMIWGGGDKIFSLELARQMKEQLGERATLEDIKNVGHLAPNEAPFAYTKRLKRILQFLVNKQ